MVDHVINVSMSLIWVLGTWVRIDEMNIRFMGKLKETHCVKISPFLKATRFLFFVLTLVL